MHIFVNILKTDLHVLRQKKNFFTTLTRGCGRKKIFLQLSPEDVFIDFREQGREEKKNINVRKKHESSTLPVCIQTHQGLNLQPKCAPCLGLEPQPSGAQDDAPTKCATRPGLQHKFCKLSQFFLNHPSKIKSASKKIYKSFPHEKSLTKKPYILCSYSEND